MSERHRPPVGVGIMVIHPTEPKILLGKRKRAPGLGMWSFPGGKLEYGETTIDCAKRELKEETGLEISDYKEALFTNEIDEDGHHITLYVIADPVDTGVLANLEPDKCEGWEWFRKDALPADLWQPVRQFLAKVEELVREFS